MCGISDQLVPCRAGASPAVGDWDLMVRFPLGWTPRIIGPVAPFEIYATGRPVPPGNQWTFADSIALILLLAAPCAYSLTAQRPERSALLFFGYGLIALRFVPVLMPDRRDCLSIGKGWQSIRDHILFIGAFIPSVGISCADSAFIGRSTHLAFARPDLTRCRRCHDPPARPHRKPLPRMRPAIRAGAPG